MILLANRKFLSPQKTSNRSFERIDIGQLQKSEIKRERYATELRTKPKGSQSVYL